MTLLTGESTPTPFYSATKTLNSDWHMALGPAAIYVSALGKTIVCWTVVGTSGSKSTQVAAYDHASDTWSERYVVGNLDTLPDDNHGNPAIVQDADGFFHVFYGSHASTQPYSVSTAANDITSWTQNAPLSGAQTYPHPNLVGSVLYFMARNDADLTREKWAVRTATPAAGVASFGSFTNLVDFGASTRVDSGEAIVVGTDIHWVSTKPNSADTSRKGVYYFVYKTTTGAVTNHDGSVSVASGSLPVDLATADASFRLFDHGSNQGEVPSLCFDTAGDPHVTFADGTGTSYQLKHIKRTSGTWSSPVVVDSFTDEVAGSGFTGLHNIVAGASGTVEAWYCDASGNKLRKIRSSGGTWGATQTVLAVTANTIRSQQAVRNGLAKFRVIFCETAAHPASDAAAVFSKRYGYGDSGAIRAAVPMTAVDASYASVALLLGFESRDANARVINEADTCFAGTSNGNAQIDTAQSKFGAASLLLDGTGDYVSFANNSLFSVSNGDFTVECWVRRNASKLQCVACKKPLSNASEWALFVNASNQVQGQGFSSSATVINISSTATLSSTSTWYHVAMSRQGSTWRIFLDGNLEASATESAGTASNSRPLLIGRDEAFPARDFNGWLDEFRFTAGVARYTASFTAPTAAFPRR